MPVRTSAVVAGGLALLTVIGVSTIFGESLRAMVAPPAADGISSAVSPTPPTGATAAKSPGNAAAAAAVAPSASSSSTVSRDGGPAKIGGGNP